MAAARHNRPTIIVYGGTMSSGVRHVDCPGMGLKKGGMVNIGDAFESYGGFLKVNHYCMSSASIYPCRCLFNRDYQ